MWRVSGCFRGSVETCAAGTYWARQGWDRRKHSSQGRWACCFLGRRRRRWSQTLVCGSFAFPSAWGQYTALTGCSSCSAWVLELRLTVTLGQKHPGRKIGNLWFSANFNLLSISPSGPCLFSRCASNYLWWACGAATLIPLGAGGFSHLDTNPLHRKVWYHRD